MPGDVYFAYEGDKVPRHFKKIRDAQDDADAQKIIDEENQKNLPPYLAFKDQVVHGG